MMHPSLPPSAATKTTNRSSLLSLITTHILRLPTTSTPHSLSQSLKSSFPSLPSPLPTSLSHSILKHLSPHPSLALLFFHSLFHLSSPPPPISPESFHLALSLTAQVPSSPRDVPSLLSLGRRLGIPFSQRTLSTLIERHVASGKPDKAVRLFISVHRFHGLHQTLPCFNALLDALCKARHVEKAHSLLRALKSRFPPDVITYNTIADGYCRRKCTSKALDLLREMVETGIQPTKNTYNIILNGFFRAGQVRHGWEFFLQMKKRGKKDCKFEPDVVTYTTVVHGLGLNGKLDRAHQVFAEMTEKGCSPTVATYNALIQVTCKKGNVEDAVKMFDEMLIKSCEANVVTYTVLIKGLCHAGKMDHAIELFEKMKQAGPDPNVQIYNILIRHMLEEGEIEKALDLFNKMGDRGACLPNRDSYNIVISRMFVRKRPEDVLTAGKMMKEMVGRGYLPTRFMFNRVLNGLLLTGNQAFTNELLRLQEKHKRLRQVIRL
ncbi:Pentatricopeptide repeat (PPR) superfamily protein [Rhynchospora pubera]|uniref:Pentatricopeptide repeat (PPR) superfamily protein n=1 Tax=Rhynchospora pubera TaxID=906938 RepID=A0AAV8HBP7_9POAL|nr:Pentatricopeptide repeat (PPR) superfamily protein [Rhynchospora pubera]